MLLYIGPGCTRHGEQFKVEIFLLFIPRQTIYRAGKEYLGTFLRIMNKFGVQNYQLTEMSTVFHINIGSFLNTMLTQKLV